MSIQDVRRTILVLDDDEIFCKTVKDFLSSDTVEVLLSGTIAEGLGLCSKRKIDVVLLDQKLPDGEGHSICSSILRHHEQAKIIFITAYPSFEHALKAIRAGAYDYLSKPFEIEELSLTVERALRALELEKVNDFQNYRTEKDSEDTLLVGAGLDKIREMIDLAAGSAEAPVLITGETGTGKNVAAKAIHYKSPARRNPFVSVNCASLPENLIEAELFGYEKGAFTGAVAAKKGIFEMAEGGTLFLDEIGEMPIHLQSKLLGALEEKKIKRLGGELMRPVHVRLIAATNTDLEKALGKTFRKDLYYRLSVIRVHIPPLRERWHDIPDLCEYLLKKIPGGNAVKLPELERSRLMEYHWPGNVRELKNVLERTVILQKEFPLLPSEILGCAEPPPSPASTGDTLITLKELEKNYVRYALGRLSYNYTRTAKALGISLSTLKRNIKNYGLVP